MPTNFDLCGQFMTVHLLRRLAVQRATAGEELHWGQLPMLEYIAAHGGCTQKELADSLFITPASVALSTKRMQKSGLIQKQPDASNLRCNLLTVTEKGMEFCRSGRMQFDSVDAVMLRGLDDAQRRQLSALLGQIINNFSTELELGAEVENFFLLHNRLHQECKSPKGACDR